MKTIKIYTIASNYQSVTVWEGSRMTGARIAQHVCTPNKRVSRKERYETIAKWLFRDFGIPAPAYKEREPK